jgi:hypothetical protein
MAGVRRKESLNAVIDAVGIIVDLVERGENLLEAECLVGESS